MNSNKRDDELLAYPDLLARSMEELRIKTAAHDRLWHLGEAAWNVDQDEGTIIFTAPDGTVARCSVQIIGTFNTSDSTWLWGWDHPSVQPPLREDAERVRAYGEAHGLERLTTRMLEATEDECWEFAALACKLADAQGAYRGPAGEAFVFMSFGQPRLSKRQGSGGEEASAGGDGDSESDSLDYTVEIPHDVRDTVTGFMAAHCRWETETFAAAQGADRATAFQDGQAAYETLIRHWCGNEVEPSGAAFGSDPTHDPAREVIRDGAVSGDKWIVRTRRTRSTGFKSDYEYHLQRAGDRWLIKSLLYVDDEGKYECL